MNGRWNTMRIASRIFIAFFSVAWLIISDISLGLGQRELTYSYREWMYVISMVNSLIIGTLAVLPSSLLNSMVAKVFYTIAIAFAEYELLMITLKTLEGIPRLYHALHSPLQMVPEQIPGLIIRSALVAVVTAAFGVALAASAAYLLLRARQNQQGPIGGYRGRH